MLVIDDEQDLLDALANLLQDEGYEVACYASPRAALDRLDARNFDVALIDLGMKEMNGRIVLQKLAAADPDLPCIVLTGDASSAAAMECTRRGAMDVIEKPFHMSKLRGLLRHAVEVRRLKRGSL